MGKLSKAKGARVFSEIKNRQVRVEAVRRSKVEAKKAKSAEKKRRREVVEVEAIGNSTKKRMPKTTENCRVPNETLVAEDDADVYNEEEFDEFAQYFNGEVEPKICITTSRSASLRLNAFIRDLLKTLPHSTYFTRRDFPIKTIISQASEEGYTDLIVLNEDRKEINSMLLCHLPEGPTAHFRLRNVVLASEIKGHGAMTPHEPEVVLNNFDTRLGHRVGRMFNALFNQSPEFKGRRVVTFHNQRDFIFFRQHRYVFEEGRKFDPKAKTKKGRKQVISRIQELGPQFSLKLLSLQHGTFDTIHGEFEFKHSNALEKETSRRHFFL